MSSSYGQAPTGPELKAQLQRRTLGKYEFELFPELWSELDCRCYYAGKTWAEVYFSSENRASIPKASGIYMFVVRSGYTDLIADHSYIFYVGKATSLRDRYASYLREQRFGLQATRPKVARFLDDFEGWISFRYVLVPVGDLEWAENLLKDNLTPQANDRVSVVGRLQPPVIV